jgi:large subunit ribosomal protein L1
MTGKIMQKLDAAVDRTKFYTAADAIALLQSMSSNRKFDQSLEVAVVTGLDTKHADQQLRIMVELPHGTGKTRRVAVFAKDAKAAEAKAAGADIVGSDDLAEAVQKGDINFDVCIATPDMMGLVGKLGKVLGPKGLMPNPKLGTVTMDVKKAIGSAKGGAVEVRAEKAGIVQAGIGKLSFSSDKLMSNLKTFMEALGRNKPTGAKGVYIKKVIISSSMGPGVKVDMTSLSDAP